MKQLSSFVAVCGIYQTCLSLDTIHKAKQTLIRQNTQTDVYMQLSIYMIRGFTSQEACNVVTKAVDNRIDDSIKHYHLMVGISTICE